MRYTVIIREEEDGHFCVCVPALNACHTWGHSAEEALAMARDAIEGYIAVLREAGDPVPPDVTEVVMPTAECEGAWVRKVTVGGDPPDA